MSDSVNTSKHAPLLNRLAQMQEAAYYATAKPTLLAAEKLIVQLEDRDILTFQREVMKWSDATFPDATPAKKASHLHDEAGELMDAPGDPEEMADVLILLCALAQMHGYDLLEEGRKKMAKNRLREWGPPDARGVRKHIKEAPAFDPEWNCPTHFAGGDPLCPACIAKQPKPLFP